MSFFSIFRHLIPTGQAFRLLTDKPLRWLFEGLSPSQEDAKAGLDAVYLDLFPSTTRELREWEAQYGLTPSPDADEEQRRLALVAEWQSTGGQSPGYIQGVLQAAGHDLYVYDFWSQKSPVLIWRDPEDYTEQPLIGTVQCSTDADICGDPDSECDQFLANDPHYFANLSLDPNPPPPIPVDSHPYFFYVGGPNFRRAVLYDHVRSDVERLIQKLKPAHLWVATLIDYVPPGSGNVELDDDGYVVLDDDGYVLIT